MRITFRNAPIAVLAAMLSACASNASDEEISKMCDRLLELRDKEGDEAMKESCVTDARNEGVTERQARCRITAVNLQEYWHRCRTGEARK